MRGITITYRYDGDEAPWRAAIDQFLSAIDADPALAGKDNPPPCRAVVGFEDGVVSEVRAKAPSARPVETKPAKGREGFTYLEFDVKQERPLLRFLLRFVPRLHVSEPATLDESLRGLAREVLAFYEADA